jgi:hypothetical protein
VIKDLRRRPDPGPIPAPIRLVGDCAFDRDTRAGPAAPPSPVDRPFLGPLRVTAQDKSIVHNGNDTIA